MPGLLCVAVIVPWLGMVSPFRSPTVHKHPLSLLCFPYTLLLPPQYGFLDREELGYPMLTKSYMPVFSIGLSVEVSITTDTEPQGISHN